jgi:hypothetical protein
VITFKSHDDLSRLSSDHPARPVIREQVEQLIDAYINEGYAYNPDDDGYIALIEEGDVDRDLDEIWDGCRLVDLPWEGASLRDGFYTAIYLANNEIGISFFNPDAAGSTANCGRS